MLNKFSKGNRTQDRNIVRGRHICIVRALVTVDNVEIHIRINPPHKAHCRCLCANPYMHIPT